MTTGFQHTTATGSSRSEFSNLIERAGGDLVIRALDPEQSLSPIPCIRGLHSVERCGLWLEAAEEVGAREKTKRLIEDRRDYLRGDRDDAPAEDVVDDDRERESDRVDEKTSSESEETPSNPSEETVDDQRVDHDGPGPDVDPGMVVSLFSTIEDIQDRLEQEASRENPRENVIAALNERKRELSAQRPDADNTASTPNVATDGGRR